MSLPAVSVAMAVHDAAPYLDESIGSILEQSFEDLELVVLENGSSDGSGEIARRHARADRRVRVFECRHALGAAAGSNQAVARSRGAVVALMDADDVSHPDRLGRQLAVLRHRPDIVLVGTLAEGIDAAGRRVRPRDRSELFRPSAVPFSHGSTMFRRADFDRIGGFRATAEPWEDADLVLRLGDHGRLVLLAEALYRYRYHVGSITASCPLEEAARGGQLLRRSLEERRAGRDHDHLLEVADGGELPPDAIVDALRRRGAVRLWAGESPGVLGELLAQGPRPSRAWLRAVAWAAAGAASPALLRLVQRCVVRLRDLAAGVRLETGAPYEWRVR